MRLRRTADLQQVEQALKEGLAAKRVLVFLDLVEDARAVGDALENGFEVLHVKHCD
jgi:hypothetical protein